MDLQQQTHPSEPGPEPPVWIWAIATTAWTHHASKELAVVITGHAPWTVELKPPVFT